MRILRLWSGTLQLLAAEEGCCEPDVVNGRVQVTLVGDSDLARRVREELKTRDLQTATWYATMDGPPDVERIRFAVEQLSGEERRCECGENNVVTTVIAGPVL